MTREDRLDMAVRRARLSVPYTFEAVASGRRTQFSKSLIALIRENFKALGGA